ncbi:MAG: hypothetical protein ACJ8ER_12190 [Allosphingosinicella sp.]
MGEEGATRSGGFWSSLPGVMTGIAALVTAVGGVYALSRQQGAHEAAAAPPGNAQSAAAPVAGEAQAGTQNMAATQPVAKPDKPVDAAPPPAPPPPPPPNFPDIAGRWQTSFGPLDFTETDVRDDSGAVVGKAARATYTSEGEAGRLAGEFEGSTLVAHWYEPNSATKCDDERGGTVHWGRIELTFNRAVNEVQGHWGYCDEPPERKWTGTRD